jgi:hypothetical protein
MLPPDLQGAFAAGLRDGTPPPGVTARDAAEVPRRFAVYRNNVAVSLNRALAARFPVIERLIGAEPFATYAHAFAEVFRPRTPVLSAWGGDFPAFLAEQPALQPWPFLADVARIEWARGLAYHAADLPPLPGDALIRAAAEPDLVRLRLHPGLSVLSSPYPVLTIWQANQPGADPTRARGANGAESLLVLRDRRLNVQVWPLGPGDAAFVRTLADATLLAAAEAANKAEKGHDPTPLLLRLAEAGALTGLDQPT